MLKFIENFKLLIDYVWKTSFLNFQKTLQYPSLQASIISTDIGRPNNYVIFAFKRGSFVNVLLALEYPLIKRHCFLEIFKCYETIRNFTIDLGIKISL